MEISPLILFSSISNRSLLDWLIIISTLQANYFVRNPNQFLFTVTFIGKGLLGKLGRKTSALDDNRRATYNISNSPAPRSESIFSTFEDEIRQLVAVLSQRNWSLQSLVCGLILWFSCFFFVCILEIRWGFMQSIPMLGVWLDLLQHSVLSLGKLPPRGLSRLYLLDVNSAVVGLENMSHFQLLY